MKWKPYRTALLLFAVARVLTAGTSHIHDILPANSDGTPATGSVVLSWPTFTGTDGVLQQAGQRAVAINGGILDLLLAATPAGVNYTVTYNFVGQRGLSQMWHVPDSVPALTLAKVIFTRPVPPAALSGSSRPVDPSTLLPNGGLPGQVLTLNSLLQWGPANAPVNSGLAGPSGSPGPIGPAGPRGALGPQGVPGQIGQVGAQGVPGIGGAQGSTGSAGATGPAGAAGAAGATGPAGAAGAVGPTGPAGPNNNLAGQPVSSVAPTDGQLIAFNATAGQYQPTTFYQEESRKLQVQTLQAATSSTVNLPAGGSVQILNVTGAGNVSMIQLALVGLGGSGADRNDVTLNGTIQICTNGEAAPCQHSDLGTFFLAHGVPAPPFSHSDNFTLTEYQDTSLMGAFRRIMIPFTNGCTITVINKSAVATGQVFSQVYYYQGAPPPQLTGSRKKTFHMATIPFTAIAQYAPVDLINISGRGAIEGIHFFVYALTTGQPTWLEGDMTWTIDGSQMGNVGGTEDFFGGQYYWGQLQYASDSWGVIKNGPFAGVAYGTGMYRLFNKDPLVFDQSIKLTWHNGQSGQGSAPPGQVNLSAIVFYYLDH